MKSKNLNIKLPREKHNELLPRERKILQYWYLLPEMQFSFYELMEFFQINKQSEILFFDILCDLQRKDMVIRSDKFFEITSTSRFEVAKWWNPKVEDCKKIVLYINKCMQTKKNEKWEQKAKYIPFAEKILTRFNQKHPELLKMSCNLAHIHGALNNNNKSIEYHLLSAKMAAELNSQYLDRTYHNTAEAYYKVKNLKKSLEYSLRFIDVKEHSIQKNTIDKQQLAYHYYNAALLYFDMMNIVKAKEYIDKVVELDQHILDEEHPDFIYDLKIQKRIHIAYTVSQHFIYYKLAYFVAFFFMILSLFAYFFMFTK